MRTFLVSSFVTLYAIALAGCSGTELAPAPESMASSSDAIIGGVAADSAALDAVGSLVTVSRWSGSTAPSYGAPFCTATLIAPRQVLTAEHCVGSLSPTQEIGFALGADGRPPKRVVPVVGIEVARETRGGQIGLGSDVAVVHLEQPIPDVDPIAIGELTANDVGKRFVGMGYGSKDVQGTAYTRRAGSMTLKGLSGRVLEHAFGSFEAFKAVVPNIEEFRWQVGDVSTPEGEQRARGIFDRQVLLDGAEAFVGAQPGDAQACHGDSGGPLLRVVDGKRTTFGVTSWGNHRFGSFCDFGSVYAVLGSEAKATITKALTWVDPREGLTTAGACAGDVAKRCSTRVEGERRALVTDCAELGQTCGKAADGQVACVDPVR